MRHNSYMKKEFAFQIEQDDDMLVATCHEPEMATQGENLDELPAMIRDLIRRRFDAGDQRLAWPIRLHFLHDPVSKLKQANIAIEDLLLSWEIKPELAIGPRQSFRVNETCPSARQFF